MHNGLCAEFPIETLGEKRRFLIMHIAYTSACLASVVKFLRLLGIDLPLQRPLCFNLCLSPVILSYLKNNFNSMSKAVEVFI